jgi:hypothetical protein
MNFTELNFLHLLLAVVGGFIFVLVLLDICDKDGMSYHRWLTGDKYKNVAKKTTPATAKKKQ